MPLVLELKTFGAMYRAEANERFKEDFVDAALARKVCSLADTQYGPVLYLSNKGRLMAGLTGYYKPTVESLENAACLRDAYLGICESGHKVDVIERNKRGSIVYEKAGRSVLALAQAEGFNRTVVRRTYRNLIEGGEFGELHLYSYLPSAEVMEFGMLMLHSKNPDALPIDPERFYIYSLTPWPQAR